MVSVEYKKLGDIATYINGYAFKPEQRGSEGLPIIRIQDLTGNAYDLGYYNGDYPKKVELNDGDVLISWSASLGVYLWNHGKALLNQHIFKVVFDKVEIDKFYFMYAVEYNLDKMSLKTHGATMKHITKKDFDNVVIPYPDLDYQKEVAYRLTSLKGIIEKYQKQLDLLDELVKARFVEMFGELRINDKGWKYYKLDELTELITDGEHATPKRTTQGIYLLSARNVLNHQLSLEDVDFIDCDEFDRISRRIIPKEGDVLISCSGSIGRCCIVPKNIKFQMVRSIALLRFKSNINPVFAEYMITSDYLQNQINKSKTASSQANLFQGKIKSLKGVVPPLELQNQFASFVQEIDKSRSRIQKSLEASQELFDSLMQEYFG